MEKENNGMSENEASVQLSETSELPSERKVSFKQILINALIFVAVLALTLTVLFREVTPDEIFGSLKTISMPYIAGGIIMMCIYILMESLNIKRTMSVFGTGLSYHMALKYAVVGFFFSSVTPASTGGKPMQILFMHRDGYSVSRSTLSLIFEVMNFELAMAVYAVIGYITQHSVLVMALGGVRYALLFGIFVNICVSIMLILAVFSKQTIRFFERLTEKIVSAFARDKVGAAVSKVREYAAEYQECAVYIKDNKPVMVRTFLTSMVQLFAMFSVPYFVYIGFGLHKYNLFQIVMLEAVAYVSLAFLPVPGAIGASEGVLVMIFRIIFPSGLVATAMLLSRSLNYYLILIASGIAVFIFTRISAVRRRRAAAYAEKEHIQ